MKYPFIHRRHCFWLFLKCTFVLCACLSWTKAEIVGLWQFDDGMTEGTRSWSTFGRSAHGKIDYSEARVGTGAYSAVHGENTRTDWRQHATGSIGLLNHARIDQAEEVGIAVWLRPVQSWSAGGRLLSFRRDGLGIAEVPGEPGRFRIVNPGLVEEGALSVMELPMDAWSHVALTADGHEVCLLLNGEVLARVPQTGKLNAADRLYLGAMDSGGVGLYGTYVDELVLYRGAADADWAREIYETTVAGEPLTVELPPVPVFQPVDRDPSVFLQLSLERLTLPADEPTTVELQAQETPMFGGYISPRLLTSAEAVLDVIEDLQAHHCNTIVVNQSWCTQRPELLRLFHEQNFRVFVIVSPPYGGDLVREFPDTAQRSASGESVKAASVYDPRTAKYIAETFLGEGLDGIGVDGVILDEPSMAGYRGTLREGELYHAHPADQAAYVDLFGEPMTVTDLKDDVDPEALEKLVTFRKRMMHDWLMQIEGVLEKRAKEVDYHVVLTPDNVLTDRRKNGLTPAEATAIDVDALLESSRLKGIQLTAYLNAWGGRPPSWVDRFLPLFLTKAHAQGKASIIWAQAYLESPRQVERGIEPGNISELIHRTVGVGADGFLLWHYRGFSQDGYGWPAFFQELSDAAAQYVNRPAEGLTFQVESVQAGLDIAVGDLGDGNYVLRFGASEPGEYFLKVRNRSGIVQRIPILVE